MAKAKPQSDQQANLTVGFVTIRIPVGDLADGEGYQISRRNPPREIRTRSLSERQGLALARIRLGMLAHSETLEPDVFNGHRRLVDDRGDVIARLLELVHIATEETR
jgi:hypothetical protein